MADLKTNYVDDVLDSSKNQLRKYQQIQNDDGTVSFVDVTEYSTTGTSFGAKDINDTNAAVNELNNSLGEKLSHKQIAKIAPNTSKTITIPYNSSGMIVFQGAVNTMMSVFQYLAYSNGLSGITIGTQGSSLTYALSDNKMTINNKSTGNYLLVKGKLTSADVLPLIIETFQFISTFEGDIPGATPRDCGNYLLNNLPMARWEAKKYLKEVLLIATEENLNYPD